MARIPRNKLPGGWYHCINRGVARKAIFFDSDDYRWFVDNLIDASREFEIELATYCLMPNHWHIVLNCPEPEAMSQMFKVLLGRHAKRHHEKYQTIGYGPIYQGRFKSIYIKDDRSLETIRSYVLQNPIRANLVKGLGDWEWSGDSHVTVPSKLSQGPRQIIHRCSGLL